MAAIDVAGFVADIKAHAPDHGFHIHDERYFLEAYSLRQVWEVDLHPEDACGGPLDLHLALEAEPRVQFAFEDAIDGLEPEAPPPDKFFYELTYNWALPPLRSAPDLLLLATDLAPIGGTDLPMRVSATDSFHEPIDPPERTLLIVATRQVSLARIFLGEETICDDLDRAKNVSEYLLDRIPGWTGE